MSVTVEQKFSALERKKSETFYAELQQFNFVLFFFLPRTDFTLSSKKQRYFVINMFTAGYNGSNISDSKCRSVKATTLYVLLEILV